MASLRTSGVQPGRLAQGPDEKLGFEGRAFGFAATDMDAGLSYRRGLKLGESAGPAGADITVEIVTRQRGLGLLR